ncbi:MAG TPA: hypothetical protein PLO37_17715 [Candidatus Hydrogenedentes bacterium]|nr:hypothetical protein [Candidatus Hydrogenedentota bacterium]HPG68687.1 hypothetical protein [Candidatus Hydrogenedentota bacterium]
MQAMREKRGAALVLAILILTVLLLVALSFFTAARLEVHTSTNVVNGLRAGLLADAGTAMAMAFLNYDFVIHSLYTSTDHAWKTYFNGAWAAGKSWMWVDGVPLTFGGVPEINLDITPNIGDWFYVPRIQGGNPVEDPAHFDAGNNPFVVTAGYAPSPLGNPAFLGLPVSTERLWPAQQIGLFADVDNDGDGEKDSTWLPVGADEFFVHDGIDNDLDSLIDEGAGPDEIDNDGDGFADEPDELVGFNGLDDDGDGFVDEANELSEPCVFVYWGGDDGRDNDGNGYVDETFGGPGNLGEQRIYLTAPIASPHGPAGHPAHLPSYPDNPSGYLDAFPVARYAQVYWVEPWPGSPTVDVLDNDWNLLVNDHQEYFPFAHGSPLWNRASISEELKKKGYDEDDADRLSRFYGDWRHLSATAHGIAPWYLQSMDQINTIYGVYSTGEPVCELVGRVAILINDESSKVNLNVAGGHTANWFPDDAGNPRPDIQRTMNEALGPWEYETRVLPQIGYETAGYLWELLMGAPEGRGLSPGGSNGEVTPDIENITGAFGGSSLVWDYSMPGYGRVDDNANLLWLALDGIDNDGDGLTDEGFYVPPAPDPDDYSDGLSSPEYQRDAWFHDAYAAQLGVFEGLDEPQERRLYRSHRNRVAEADGIDNDNIPARASDYVSVVDEVGELGDRVLSTIEQVKPVFGVSWDWHEGARHPASNYERIRRLITLHSTDVNTTFEHIETGTAPEVSDLKLDLRFARAYSQSFDDSIDVPGEIADVADMLKRDWSRHFQPMRFYRHALLDYDTWVAANSPAGVDPIWRDGLFAAGLRQEDTTVLGTPWDYDAANRRGEIHMVADNELRAYKLSATLQDDGDADHTRTLVRSMVDDDWWQFFTLENPASAEPFRRIEYAMGGIESIRINEVMVRPVRRVEAEMLTPKSPMVGVLSELERFLPMFDPHRYDMYQSPPAFRGFACNFTFPGDHPNEDVAGGTYGFRLSFDMTQSFRSPSGEDPVDYAQAYWYLPWEFAATTLVNPTAPKLGAGTSIRQSVPFRMSTEDGFPNVVQFRFGPSTGLPPGRYYLLLNTATDYRDATVYAWDTLAQPLADPYRTEMVQYLVKYGYADETYVDGVDDPRQFSILRDINDGLAFEDPPGVPMPNPDLYVSDSGWQTDARVGYWDMENPVVRTAPDDDGNESGWLWLPSSSTDADAGLDPREHVGYNEDYAHTVRIPGYDEMDISGKQLYLYVAIRINPNLDEDAYDGAAPSHEIAFDFFDFSQEPDHEWVELVNIAQWDPNVPAEDQAIDLSDWVLEVGPPVQASPKYKIPTDTRIAPGGSILLTFNKFDYGADYVGVPHFMKNGIGMATHAADPSGSGDIVTPPPPTDPAFNDRSFWVTVPPTMLEDFIDETDPNVRPNDPDPAIPIWTVVPPHEEYCGAHAFDDRGDTDPLTWDEVGASVFTPVYRPPRGPIPEDFTGDFRDWNGDGYRDARNEDDDVTSAPESYTGENLPDEAFDRIVELEETGLDSVDNLDDMTKIILGGGFLPNYPEHDGIDNDNDNLTLSTDSINNDGDFFDSGIPGQYDSGTDLPVVDESDEGIDEGRWQNGRFFDPPGSFKQQTNTSSQLPLSFDLDPTDANPAKDIGFVSEYTGEKRDLDGYLVSPAAPMWREFVERRWFPGDCVFISLYEPLDPAFREREAGYTGSPAGIGERRRGAANLMPVDRVTYTERDVVNRAIDDRLSLVYDTDGDGDVDAADGYARNPLNAWFPTMWPENTMGIDFYRSLERKHPLYSGDRFGTTNRWQATDGNYDDWEHSLSFWHTVEELAGISSKSSLDVLEFAHTMIGSPLRMNYGQRRIEAASAYFEGDLTDGERAGLWRFSGGANRYLGSIRNRPYHSPADVRAVPHLVLRLNLDPMGYDFDDDTGECSRPFGWFEFGHPGYGLETDGNRTEFEFVEEVLLGERLSGQLLTQMVYSGGARDDRLMPTGSPVDVAALAGSGVCSDSVELALGEADVFLFYGGLWLPEDRVDIGTTLYGGQYLNPAPQAYVPVYLFSFDFVPTLPDEIAGREQRIEDTALFHGSALFGSLMNPGFGMDLDLHELIERWAPATGAPDLRRVAYVAGHYPGFLGANALNVDDPDASPMAFFVWDADVGLENGQYDVYVALADPMLDRLRAMYAREVALCRKAILDGKTPSGLVLTDDNPDDGVYEGLLTEFGVNFLDQLPSGNPVVRGRFFTDPKYTQRPELINEGFIQSDVRLEAGAGANGIVKYPFPVTVKNNYLALRVRNWSDFTEISPFSRIILTPRQDTPGRINLNTTETRKVEIDPGNSQFFNPLMGLPGILAEYDPDARTVLKRTDPDPTVPVTGVRPIVIPTDDIALPAGPNFASPNTVTGRLYHRAQAIVDMRPEWPDGRYYRSPSDLLGYVNYSMARSGFDAWGRFLESNEHSIAEIVRFGPGGYPEYAAYPWWRDPIPQPSEWERIGQELGERLGLTGMDLNSYVSDFLSEMQAVFLNGDFPEPGETRMVRPLLPDVLLETYPYPMNNPGEFARWRFNEDTFRYSRLLNLVTVRSDVFEIIVTAQAGYGADMVTISVDGSLTYKPDGKINYRNAQEFIVTGEKKTRIVYHR